LHHHKVLEGVEQGRLVDLHPRAGLTSERNPKGKKKKIIVIICENNCKIFP
jgi:hypothetical protein